MSTGLLPEQRGAVPAAIKAELPLLAECFAPDRVREVFALAWGRQVRGGRLIGCRVDPGPRAVTTHELDVEGEAVVAAVEVTATCRRVWRSEDDADLPGLRIASDAALMASSLARAVGAVDGCAVRLWRYRPAQRAVLRYELAAAEGPVVLFGKLLRQGAGTLARVLHEVHRAGCADPGLPLVVAPVCVLDELGLVVQPALVGQPLHQLAYGEAVPARERVSAFERTGSALAALHAGERGVDTATVDTVDADADAVGVSTDASLAERIAPDLGALIAAALGRVTTASRARDPSPVPSHGALRTDQVVLVAGRPAFLDLDGYCLAPRERDLGNLLAYLRWRAIRQPQLAGAIAESRRAFLAGYGVLSDGELARFEALALLKIAGRRVRNLTTAEWPLVPDLVTAATALVEGRSGA